MNECGYQQPVQPLSLHDYRYEVSPDKARLVVTFTVPAELGGQRAYLAGSCTAWVDVAMNPCPDGSFALTVEFPVGQPCAFHFTVDGVRWLNDWQLWSESLAELPVDAVFVG